MSAPKDDLILKICAAGSYGVGKTSLIRRYAENKFSSSYTPTIGVDITTKRVTVDNHQIKLLLIDTAGQEYFGKIRKTYFEGAFGCIVVYDITRRESFLELDRWISDFRGAVGENALISIIGNKIDLDDSRTVTNQEGKSFTEQYGIPFYECSAKLGGEIIIKVYIDMVSQHLSSLNLE
ncbi:MAG: GTP-binding protein [Candidatus Heimdallarchaeota archaeon]|nr:MAG: GTP-binding protein [Candidatus Heimdallarchaeota archaeon]